MHFQGSGTPLTFKYEHIWSTCSFFFVFFWSHYNVIRKLFFAVSVPHISISASAQVNLLPEARRVLQTLLKVQLHRHPSPLANTKLLFGFCFFWSGGGKKKKISWILFVFGLFFFKAPHRQLHSFFSMVFPFKAYNLYSSGSSSRSPLSLLYPLSSSLLEGTPCAWSEPPPTPPKRTTLTPAYEWAHEGKKPGRAVTIFSLFFFNPAEAQRRSLWRERMLRSPPPPPLWSKVSWSINSDDR